MANTLPGPDTTHFREYYEAINLSEQDIVTVSAPNKEPFGGQPGPAAAHEHAPQKSGKPANEPTPGSPSGPGQGVNTHGTPAKGPANKNRLH